MGTKISRTNKLNIGVLTEIVSGASGARAPLEIAKHLADLGHLVTVYAYSYFLDKNTQHYLTKNGVIVKLIERPAKSRYLVVPQMFQRLRMGNHDVLYFSGTPPFFIAGLLTRVPIVRMYQGTQYDAYLEKYLPNQKISLFDAFINYLLNIAIYLIDLFSFRLSTTVVAISQFAKKEGEHLYKRTVTSVIYHGSKKVSEIDIHGSKSTVVQLISVSRLTPYKGFHKIIEALKKMPTVKKWKLTIVGSQPKPNYVHYLKNLDPKNVRLITNLSDADLASQYMKSDIYVTCDRYLYFGLPIFEAAHFGLPTVAFDSAAAKEIVSHYRTGFVAKNESQLISHLTRLIEQPKLRFALGKAAQKRAQQFSWHRCARQWERVLMRSAKRSR